MAIKRFAAKTSTKLAPNRGARRRKRKASTAKTSNPKRRRKRAKVANPLHKKRKHKRSAMRANPKGRKSHRRRRNPYALVVHKRHHKKRRNPGFDPNSIVVQGVAVAVGGGVSLAVSAGIKGALAKKDDKGAYAMAWAMEKDDKGAFTGNLSIPGLAVAHGVPAAIGGGLYYFGKKKNMPLVKLFGAGMSLASVAFFVHDAAGGYITEKVQHFLNPPKDTKGVWMPPPGSTAALMQNVVPQHSTHGAWLPPPSQQPASTAALMQNVVPVRRAAF